MRVLVLLSLLGSLCNLVPPWFWLIEVNLSFGYYYLIAHVAALLLFPVWGRGLLPLTRWITAIAMLVMSLWYVRIVAPFYQGPAQLASSEHVTRLRILYANVYRRNKEKEALLGIIQEYKPDIVGLLELDDSWVQSLQLLREYPHFLEFPSNDDDFGIGLYSKYRFVREGSLSIGNDMPRILNTYISVVQGRELELTLLHGIPPKSSAGFALNAIFMKRLSTRCRQDGDDLVVFGDFNATPFSPLYKRFTLGCGLQNAMLGQGWLGTWQADSLFVRVPIDHVLFRGKVGVLNFKRGPAFGSDHFPLVVDLALME